MAIERPGRSPRSPRCQPFSALVGGELVRRLGVELGPERSSRCLRCGQLLLRALDLGCGPAQGCGPLGSSCLGLQHLGARALLLGQCCRRHRLRLLRRGRNSAEGAETCHPLPSRLALAAPRAVLPRAAGLRLLKRLVAGQAAHLVSFRGGAPAEVSSRMPDPGLALSAGGDTAPHTFGAVRARVPQVPPHRLKGQSWRGRPARRRDTPALGPLGGQGLTAASGQVMPSLAPRACATVVAGAARPERTPGCSLAAGLADGRRTSSPAPRQRSLRRCHPRPPSLPRNLTAPAGSGRCR
jgi:hypothetical protein